MYCIAISRETIIAKYITPKNICKIDNAFTAGKTGVKFDNPVADCKLKLKNKISNQD